MKININQHQTTASAKYAGILFILALICFGAPVFGQDEEKKDDGKKAARPAFESAQLMDEQSVVVPSKKTLEFNIQHRFGTVENGIRDIYGIYAPGANIRLGFTYTPINNLAIGFGATKTKKYIDFNAKYAILKQRKNWSIPVSVTFFTNVVIHTNDKEQYPKDIYRFAYFEQLIIAARLSPKISLQIAPSFSHYNAMDSAMSHNMIAFSVSGRYKLSPQSSILVSYMQQMTKHDAPNFKLKPGMTLGWEIATSSHAFQIFFTTLQGIMPQDNVTFNQLDISKNQFLLGFNITRLWGF